MYISFSKVSLWIIKVLDIEGVGEEYAKNSMTLVFLLPRNIFPKPQLRP